jgi:hypothetical protein
VQLRSSSRRRIISLDFRSGAQPIEVGSGNERPFTAKQRPWLAARPRRTTKLFLPNGGWHFLSRQAYKLGYACQREDRFSRLQRRAAMLNRQLGGKGWDTWDEPPDKPKWMRWRTYEEKYERWEQSVGRANEEFLIYASRLLGRC